MEEIVRIVDLPFGIEALTLIDDDGTPNIYINAKLNPVMREKALEHEREHIRRDDWHNPLPVWMIENIVRNAV